MKKIVVKPACSNCFWLMEHAPNRYACHWEGYFRFWIAVKNLNKQNCSNKRGYKKSEANESDK